MTQLSLEELVARAQARSDTDPTWRTDYRDEQTRRRVRQGEQDDERE